MYHRDLKKLFNKYFGSAIKFNMTVKAIEWTVDISRNLIVAQCVQYNLLAYMYFDIKIVGTENIFNLLDVHGY